MYLWIMDHQHYLREQFGAGVETAHAVEHFADHYTTRPIKRILHAVQEFIAGQSTEEEFGTEETEEG